MAINSGKGGKKCKKGKNKNEDLKKRELLFKEDGQEYAVVEALLGNGRMSLRCGDGAERLGIVRGKMRKRDWVARDDLVLVGLRDFQDCKADIIAKYTSAEAGALRRYGELDGLRVKEEQEAEEDLVDFEADDFLAAI